MKKILETFKNAKKVLIISHQKPDGDTAGSALALAHFLHDLQKEYHYFCKDVLGEYLHFLPKSEEATSDHEVWSKKHDVIVVVDSGDLKYAGVDEHVQKLSHPYTLINIDHHATNPRYGHHNLVDSTAAATCELVFDLLEEARAITPKIATCLLTGIVTDTGCFSNLGTTHRVMKKAGKLLAHGANFPMILENTFKHRPIGTLKIWGRALSRLEEQEGIATTAILKKDIQEERAGADAVEGIANLLNALDPDANQAVMVFYEQGGRTKVSMRTTHDLVDLARFAKMMGGGGHQKAAGFFIPGELTPQKISEYRLKLIHYLCNSSQPS